MADQELITGAARKAGAWLGQNNQVLVTVESCTGGGVAQAVTRIAGSSAWFDRGFVTYSNLAKQQLVDVSPDMFDQYGAVSEEVARAMAIGGLEHSNASICLSVTGIAGPQGGTAKKPIGTVCFARADKEHVVSTTMHFAGDREAIRNAAIIYALDTLLHLKQD